MDPLSVGPPHRKWTTRNGTLRQHTCSNAPPALSPSPPPVQCSSRDTAGNRLQCWSPFLHHSYRPSPGCCSHTENQPVNTKYVPCKQNTNFKVF